MLFRKPKEATCVVCGKAIDRSERRFVEKDRVTKVERHTHVDCKRRVDDVRSPAS